MKIRGAFALFALAFALVFGFADNAHADEPSMPGPDVDAGLNPGTMRPLWELGLGVAGLRLPDYIGSDESGSYLLPLPYIVYRGTFLKADRDGARALLFSTQRVKVDVSVAGSTPARSSGNTARRGMPDLAGTLELGPNLNVTLANSQKNRWKIDLRLPLRAAVSIERSPDFIGTTFSPNVNLDLGVDAAYATPGRPAYAARGGYAGWRAVAATSRRFGNMWVGGFVRYNNLDGAAFEDSPLVRRTSGVTFGVGVSWVLATSSELVAASD